MKMLQLVTEKTLLNLRKKIYQCKGFDISAAIYCLSVEVTRDKEID